MFQGISEVLLNMLTCMHDFLTLAITSFLQKGSFILQGVRSPLLSPQKKIRTTGFIPGHKSITSSIKIWLFYQNQILVIIPRYMPNGVTNVGAYQAMSATWHQRNNSYKTTL